jgi:hypothetical protein
MPFKCDKIAINNEKLDKRVKLTAEDKQEILNFKGVHSTRVLSRMYNVDRRTIQFILDPNKQVESLKRRAERGGSKVYYDKENHRLAMQAHRDYKKQLYSQGLIG